VTAFDTAARAVFRDRNLSVPAVWRAGGTGTPVDTRVVLATPDEVAEFGAARVRMDSVQIFVPVADAPTLQRGDRVTLEDGTIYELRGDPVRDAQRLMWSAEAREVTP
jgi:hypothetical protein